MIAKLLYLVCAVALVQARPPATGEVLSNGCPASGDVHKYLPHETDSAQFYRCVNGEKIQGQCPIGRSFNAALQVCDNSNTRNTNKGVGNTGKNNIGKHNSGNNNKGNFNSGNNNIGNNNSGYYNKGNHNTGNYNTGHYNSGNHHIGSYS